MPHELWWVRGTSTLPSLQKEPEPRRDHSMRPEYCKMDDESRHLEASYDYHTHSNARMAPRRQITNIMELSRGWRPRWLYPRLSRTATHRMAQLLQRPNKPNMDSYTTKRILETEPTSHRYPWRTVTQTLLRNLVGRKPHQASYIHEPEPLANSQWCTPRRQDIDRLQYPPPPATDTYYNMVW